MSALRKPYTNSMGLVGGTDITDEGDSRARVRWPAGITLSVINTYVGAPQEQAGCNCTAGDTPCRLYPAGLARGRKGRCEGCTMGLHRGHVGTPITF